MITLDYSSTSLNTSEFRTEVVNVLEALGANGTVTELNLVRCDMRAREARALGRVLKTNRSLLALHIDEADVGLRAHFYDHCADQLAQALRENDTLLRFSLLGGLVTSSVVPAFARMLGEANRTLQSFTLKSRNCGKGAPFAEALQAMASSIIIISCIIK